MVIWVNKMKKFIIILLILIMILLIGCSNKNISDKTCQEMCNERSFENSECVQTSSIFGYSKESIDEENKAFNSTPFCHFDAYSPLEETDENTFGWKYMRPSD